MSVRERIAEIIEIEKLNVNSFSNKIGVPQSSIQSMFDKETEPSSKTIIKMLSAFPFVSAEWLMRGEGPMLKQDMPGSVNIDASHHSIKSENSSVIVGDNNTDLAMIRKLQETIDKLQKTIEAQQTTISKLVEKL